MPSLVTDSGIDAVSGGSNNGGGGGPPARVALRAAATSAGSGIRGWSIAVSVYGPGGTFCIENDPSGAASACSIAIPCTPGVALTVFDERFTLAPGAGPPDELSTTPEIVAARATSAI